MKSNQSKLKQGSIASEAARLTIELGFLVSSDQIRHWRKRDYPLNNTPLLLQRLKNQERIGGKGDAYNAIREKAKAIEATEANPDHDDESEYEPETPSLAELLIPDEAIRNAKGFVPMADVLEYIRDEWTGHEWSAKLFVGKTEDELDAMLRRHVASNFASLKMLWPWVARPAWPDWLDAILYPDEAGKPESLVGEKTE